MILELSLINKKDFYSFRIVVISKELQFCEVN